MKQIIVPLGFALLVGLSLQSTSHAYNTTAVITVDIGGNSNGVAPATADLVWTLPNGPNPFPLLSPLTNATYLTTLTSNNSLGYYNADFVASTEACNPGAGIVPPSFIPVVGGFGPVSARKYGCRYFTGGVGVNPTHINSPLVDIGPVARATGSITVTDTTLTGVLTIVATTDELTGAIITNVITFPSSEWTSPLTTRISNSVGNGVGGYNYRFGDAAPFGTAWYGITTAGTYTLNLTGTFTSTSWQITGGTAQFNDPGFACQQVGNGDARGIMCSESPFGTAGGFDQLGGNLSWGMDPDGAKIAAAAPTMIEVRDSVTNVLLDTLSGVLASLSVDPSGNITTSAGEFRRAWGAGASGSVVNYSSANQTLTGQTTALTAGKLVITGLADADSDGVGDGADNCPIVANANQADGDTDLRGNACDNCSTLANNTGAGAQADSDVDGYGNRCDGDMNNNLATNSQDYVLFRAQLGTSSVGPVYNKADINVNGAVNSQDYVLFRGLLGAAPGPGAAP